MLINISSKGYCDYLPVQTTLFNAEVAHKAVSISSSHVDNFFVLYNEIGTEVKSNIFLLPSLARTLGPGTDFLTVFDEPHELLKLDNKEYVLPEVDPVY